MALVFLEDIRLNAVIEGPVSAPGLVLIHSLGTDLTVWDGLIAHLPSLRVLRHDLRGHGRSDAPVAPYSMGALVRDTERLMDHFAMKEAVVLGLSEGGMIAQGLAVKRLDLVRAMVLANSATRIATPEIWAARIAGVRDRGIGPMVEATMAQTFGPGWTDAPAMPQVRAMLQATDPEGWMGVASAVAGSDFYATTATLTLPTLALAGAEDRIIPPDMTRETAGLVRGSVFSVLRRSGHLPPLDAPEALAAAMGVFLQGIGHV